ncbi:uncharacterized protein TNCV_4578521 [Trichonephila clavipes]|nr:uncharacterized protein TNCV_4578521 [Trichonephila clavipes]
MSSRPVPLKTHRVGERCTLNLSRAQMSSRCRQAASPLVRLVEGEERWEAPDHPQCVHPQNWDETELNRSVTCMMSKATDNDRRHLALCHDEFRGPLPIRRGFESRVRHGCIFGKRNRTFARNGFPARKESSVPLFCL